MFLVIININISFMENTMILDETVNNMSNYPPGVCPPDFSPPDDSPQLALIPLSNDYCQRGQEEGLPANLMPVLLFDDEDEDDDMSDDEGFDDMEDDFDDDFDDEDDFDDDDEDYEDEDEDFDYEEDVDYDDFDE